MADPAIPLTKSRRRIAGPQGSKQDIVAGQTGRLEVVKTLSNVRFGSKADIEVRLPDVRFTPESGHPSRAYSRADVLDIA